MRRLKCQRVSLHINTWGTGRTWMHILLNENTHKAHNLIMYQTDPEINCVEWKHRQSPQFDNVPGGPCGPPGPREPGGPRGSAKKAPIHDNEQRLTLFYPAVDLPDSRERDGRRAWDLNRKCGTISNTCVRYIASQYVAGRKVSPKTRGMHLSRREAACKYLRGDCRNWTKNVTLSQAGSPSSMSPNCSYIPPTYTCKADKSAETRWYTPNKTVEGLDTDGRGANVKI